MRSWQIIAFCLASVSLSACGTMVPRIEEPWEDATISGLLEFNIKKCIFCETVEAIRAARANNTVGGRSLLGNASQFGVQMQLTMTVEEVGAFNPSVGGFRTFKNVTEAHVPIPQSITGNITGVFSSTATTVHTSYSYYNFARISDPGKNDKVCDKSKEDLGGSSFLLQSDLGISEYLRAAVFSAAVFHSSEKKLVKVPTTAKLDVFSNEIKFVVVTSGGINPVIKIANLTTGTGSLPLFTAGRTRTHDLILTFGPGDDKGPSPFALQVHTNAVVGQSRQPAN